MKDHYYHLFQKLPFEALPQTLVSRINREIALLEKRATQVRRLLFASLGGIFLAAFIPAATYLSAQFSESSFISYASLFFTDSDVALSNAQAFLLSLVESLPLAAITLTLTLVFLLLGAMRLIGTKTRAVVETLSAHPA